MTRKGYSSSWRQNRHGASLMHDVPTSNGPSWPCRLAEDWVDMVVDSNSYRRSTLRGRVNHARNRSLQNLLQYWTHHAYSPHQNRTKISMSYTLNESRDPEAA